MYFRFFAQTDESAAGQLARAYLRSLLRVAPVRLVSVTGGAPSAGWAPMWGLTSTPMDETPTHGHRWINVVATSPEHWTRRHTVQMPASLVGAGPAEKASRVVELYTEGVRNVLILVNGTAVDRAIADRYEVQIVPPTDHHSLRLFVLGDGEAS